MNRHLFASLALLCSLSGWARATTYTVNNSSDPSFTTVTAATGVINDGSGAGTVSLRSAVIAANSNGAGPHVITVPAGTYNLSATNPNSPGTTATTGNPDLQVGSHLSTITIQGSGGTPKIVQTIAGNDVITTGFKSDGFTPAVVNLTLDNLEITGGTFTGIFVGADDGAGNVSSTTITHCNIHHNSNSHATYGQGGAIQAITGHLSISNTIFADNSAAHPSTGQGGAIYYSLPNASGQYSTGSLNISNCTFTSNTASLSGGIGGGAIYANVVSAGAAVSITGCSFISNNTTAGADGGAIAIDGNRSTDILKNTFVSNSVSTTGHGGAIVVNNGPTNIQYNRFSGNTAATAANGNALHHSTGNLSVVNANDNWWQSNSGPPTNAITGATVTASTWLRFTHTASPASASILSPDNTSTLTVSFLTNSADSPVSPANLTTVIGQPVSFGSAVLGGISGAQATIQANGTATATFTTGGTPGAGSADATVHTTSATAAITVTAPDMTVAMSHSGNFIQGETGKTYTLTASNVGNATSGGLVTSTISLPPGLTATGLGGTGWTIAPDFLSATRSDTIAASAAYPPLTLTVDVSATAGSPLSPSTTISGGGQVNLANDTSVDSTIVLSTDARLSNLTASLGSMSPTFSSATTDYVLLVPAGTSSITLTPTVFQANATVTVNGNPVTSGNASGAITIGVGDTVITTLVTAQDGVTQKTYTVTAKTPPAIGSFTYDSGSGSLAATGSGMTLGDTITVSKLTLSGEGGATYTLTSPQVTASSATSFAVNLNSTDQAALRLILNKNGTSSTGGGTYNVAAADDWDASFTSGDTSDVTNPLTVTNVPAPTITSAAYDALAGSLNVTGSGFSGASGSNNDIVANKFTLTGEGGATYTLTDTSNGDVTASTSFTLTLSATDKAAINTILNKSGTSSTSGTTYNFAAAEDWAAGADPAVVTADLTGNGITVSNVAIPTITSATYNVGTGALSITGNGFVSLSGAANDIDLTKITLSGDSTPYTLTSPSVEITSGTSFSATLNATDIAALGSRLNKNGTASIASVTYNLAAAEDWAAGADSVVNVANLTGNGITVSNALNLAPVVTVPANIAVTEDTASALTGISFSDPDAGSSSVATTLTSGGGTLSATSGGGVTVAGSGTGSITLTGAIANINAFIAGSNLSFTTTLDSVSDVNLVVSIDDNGNTGSGGAKTDSENTTLVASAVNDAPTIAAPGSIAVTEDTASALTGISFADADASGSSVSAILSVASGTLTATSGGGVTVAGSGTGSLILSGSVTNLNSFIAGSGVGYLTALNATANITLSMGINDNGNTGSGGAQSAATTATLALTAVNDAPAITAPVSQSLNQDSSLTFNSGNSNLISVSDVDMAAGTVRMNLSVTHGTFSLGGTSGLAFSVGSGTGDTTMAFTGTLTNVNNALSGMVFTPTSGYNGPAALQIDANDQGNTGSGGAKTASHTVNLTVNPINPLVTSVSSSNANGTFKIGDTVNITVSFDMIVNVTGTPTVLLATSPANRVASCISGSGTQTLVFAYTVQSGDTASDLDYVSTSSLALNGGTIQSALTLDAVLNLPTPGGANSIAGQKAIAVDGVRPTATIVVADTALRIGETSLVTITFSEVVSGFTNADLTVANGSLGSVSSADGGITWTATFNPTSGITDASNLITLDNTGVTDAAGNTGSGTTDSNNYAIDTVRPTAMIVVADNALRIGETSMVTITFNEAVSGFTNADLTIANGTLSAVSSGDGGITWTATLTPNTGITDASNLITLDNTGVTDAAGNAGAGNTDSNNYAIDTVRPTATIVIDDTALKLGDTPLVTIVFSEPVSGFTLADLSVPNGTLGTLGAGSDGVTYRATFTPNTDVTDPTNVITLDNSGVQDAAGNAGTGTTDSNNFAIDTQVPTITSVNVPANGIYKQGDVLGFTVNLSEPVVFTAQGFNSLLQLDIGGTGRPATYISGNNTNALTYQYTVQAGDNDGDGISMPVNIGFFGNAIQDAAGNILVRALNNVASTAGVLVDTTAPVVSSLVRIDSSPTNAAAVGFTLTFSEAVTGVDASDLTLATTGSAAGWIASVTPVDALTYTVLVSSVTGDGTLGLDLNNSGTEIQDAAGNPIATGFTGEVYSIDRVAPAVTSVSVPANAVYRLGQTMDFTVTFSEPVFVSGKGTLPRIPITLDHGGITHADYLSGDGTDQLVFRTTVQSGQADTNGITVDPAIDPNGASIADAVGNDAVPTLNSVAPTTGVLVDAIPPVVVNGGIPDQTLKMGGVSKTITLSSYFSDIGSSSMTYTVTANSNASRASANIAADKVTISPLANGITEVTIQADDGHGGTVTDTFQIAVGTTNPTPLQVGTTGTLNSQSGLFELTVRVTNTTPLPINGFRLYVDYNAYKTAYPSLRLYNASSAPGASKVYVDYPFPVAVNQMVAMKLSFYTSTRTFPSPFQPKLTVEKLATSQVPSSNGEGVQPRIVRKNNGTILLEFDSVIGRWYRVSFTNDLVNWYDSPVPIQASTTRMQWIDSGPPFTDVPPAKSKMRFYRVNKIKAP